MLRRRAVQQRGCLVVGFSCSGRTLFICCLFGFNSSKDMLLYLFLFFSHFIGLIAGDKIYPVRDEDSGREGRSVTLTCQYQTADDYVYLHWYRHDSDLQAPQFILWKGEGTERGKEYIPDNRYQTQASDTSTELTISRLTLADTALYYCASGYYWWYDSLLFGRPIKLTVTPSDTSPVEPNLFVLTPLLPEERPGPDVCLATGFRPQGGQMVLKLQNSSDTRSTGGAALSLKEKTYFFAGFSSERIDSCELHKTVAQRKEPDLSHCKKPDDSIPPSPPEKDKDCGDLRPEKARLNFYLLVMNGVRVLFTKTLAFNTILTIRAVLF